MRILKPGKLPPEVKTLRGVCPNCTCEFEVSLGECKGSHSLKDSSYFWTCLCPTKGCRVWVGMEPSTGGG